MFLIKHLLLFLPDRYNFYMFHQLSPLPATAKAISTHPPPPPSLRQPLRAARQQPARAHKLSMPPVSLPFAQVDVFTCVAFKVPACACWRLLDSRAAAGQPCRRRVRRRRPQRRADAGCLLTRAALQIIRVIYPARVLRLGRIYRRRCFFASQLTSARTIASEYSILHGSYLSPATQL